VKQIKITACIENLDSVLDFINEQPEFLKCSVKIQTQINIAVEEIFVNIAHYAYPDNCGYADILFEYSAFSIKITFIDNGIPYNPLSKKDPDITLPAEERQIGGLGIYMVKKSMDDISYKYKDGQNILVIVKNVNIPV